MGKKKKNKKNKDIDSSYSEFHYDGDLLELMKNMADGIEFYLNTTTRYMIIENITEEEYKSAVKQIKKLIKKLREGDTSVFSTEGFNELVDSGHGYLLEMKS